MSIKSPMKILIGRDLHAVDNLSITTVGSEVGTTGNGKNIDRKEVSRDK